MSETLEAMARALFKSWFVDFEPVRAKMEGRWRRNPPRPLGEGLGVRACPPDLLEFARSLRKTATDAESLLWRLLRNRGIEGAKFRRQHPIPPYVLDFYCHELKLAIEVDGGQHNEAQQRKRDEERTAFLESRGIRVLRFWNREVLHETEGVLQAIYQAIVERRQEVLPSPPAPLPQGEGDYLPAHLYDLFPDRLVDSEIGEIPEGWGVTTLPEVIEVNPSRPLRKGQIAPYLDMANMPTRGHVPDEVIERPFGSGMRFINGDTLVARITPCLENGKTAFIDFLQEGQVGWGSTEYIVLRPRPPLPDEFAYCLARSDSFREFAIQSMTGTSGRQRVQADSLAHYHLPWVPQRVAEAFGHSIKPLFARSSAAARESRTLAALRDALLPKLISGELRVGDAERFLKERGL
ncbi:MAG: DUF559 domain-containing protein, partial [Chlorobi bacterium]|nr:DUF559 domain-containing protein [Chlorobiota bacterium]